MEALQAMGVQQVDFHFGRAADGHVFTNLTSVVPVRGHVVDVPWLEEVRLLCEQMSPCLYAATICVSLPDDEGPGSECMELVAEGDLMVFVWLRLDGQIHAQADVVIPASDLEPPVTARMKSPRYD